MTKRIAVVGGGIFGVTTAAVLARSGHRVSLFERRDDLLCAASGINQLRLHRGYHYPRSVSTALASRDAVSSFRSFYGDAVVDGGERIYAIARERTLTDGAAFLAFLDQLGLEHKLVEPSFVRADAVELCVAVHESLIDLPALRRLAWSHVRDAGVEVRISTSAEPTDLQPFELVVVATYASLNALVGALGGRIEPHQFEVVEKPLVRPPATLRGRSIVVLDGPFMCIDPYGRSDLSLMGNVVHAIHRTSVGERPEIPTALEPLLDRGLVKRPPVTAFPRFVEAATAFVPDAAEVEHVGSMFTIRAVFPGLEATDARPTYVTRHGDRVVAVFSGKIGSCVRAAEEVALLIEGAADVPVAVEPPV